MTCKNSSATDRIRTLNDALRRTFRGGKIMMTIGVQNLGPTAIEQLVNRLQSYDEFNVDNDPHGEHDFGAFEIATDKFFWKIDYYDPTLNFASEDPSDPQKTTRVLTLMLAEEY